MTSNNSDSKNDGNCTPPEIREAAESVASNLLPSKSKDSYECAYKLYVEWKKSKGASISSESVLVAYFDELSTKYKPTTLWSLYSKLKSTIGINEKIDISKYNTLSAFMKKQSRGFRSKKSNVLTAEQITSFLTKAPNLKYLVTKVTLIFGLFGAMRSDELTRVQLDHIKQQGTLLEIQIPKTKTMLPRSFVIAENCVSYVNQYQSLRPDNVSTNRFFLNYQNGKCTSQVIGKNKFSAMPKQIAEFLDLPNRESYTGHCFRRTSATVLVDNGANMETLKRHGGWKSSAVAEGYIAESLGNKRKIGSIINSSLNLPSCSTETDSSEGPTSSKKFKNENISDNVPMSRGNSDQEHSVNLQNCVITINYNTSTK